jgi:ubiquinone/menaquinone biosynthesis C-methylase UbiE
MAEMVALEKLFCRSGPWRSFARRVVLPWALQGEEPRGNGLEIGAGSGLIADELLRSFPELDLVVTDFDADMLEKGRAQLKKHGSRARVEVADATSLSFPDSTFDYVFSFIMLHHVVEWEKALAEAMRVVRPGGTLVGYDLLDTRFLRAVHAVERAEVRLMTLPELYTTLDSLPVDRAVLTKTGRSLVRLKLRKES